MCVMLGSQNTCVSVVPKPRQTCGNTACTPSPITGADGGGASNVAARASGDVADANGEAARPG